jgi:hypothetical protein
VGEVRKSVLEIAKCNETPKTMRFTFEPCQGGSLLHVAILRMLGFGV